MGAWNILLGVFMIILGLLVKNHPYLISGYNTMSAEKRKNVDIDGLSNFIRTGFVAIGITIITGFAAFRFLNWYSAADFVGLPVILIGVMIIVIIAPKYDHNIS